LYGSPSSIRPSFTRASSIACAAASPAAMPRVLASPSGIAPIAVSYFACTVASCDGVITFSTLYAAAATAASFESSGPARSGYAGWSRYRSYPPSISFTAS
jgi:hypothetical protein